MTSFPPVVNVGAYPEAAKLVELGGVYRVTCLQQNRPPKGNYTITLERVQGPGRPKGSKTGEKGGQHQGPTPEEMESDRKAFRETLEKQEGIV